MLRDAAVAGTCPEARLSDDSQTERRTAAAAQFTTSKIIPKTNEQNREKQHVGESASSSTKLQDINVCMLYTGYARKKVVQVEMQKRLVGKAVV